MAAFATTSTAAPETPQLMFVQSADDFKADPPKSTFRLVKVNQQTMYFSDRPLRIVGHIKMAAYLKEWTTKAGKDNFGADPPNATLSIYEPGQAENTIVVVKLTNPVVDGADLIYTYKVLDGTLPANGGRIIGGPMIRRVVLSQLGLRRLSVETPAIRQNGKGDATVWLKRG